MSSASIDIVISDDHAMFRQGLRKLLESEPALRIVGEAADGEETARLVRRLNPQVLLLDLSLPGADGLQVLKDLGKLLTTTRTILLTADIEGEQILEALKLGAHGIVLKHSALQILIESIRCVHAGQYWIGQEGVSDLVQALRRTMRGTSEHSPAAPQEFGLTAREREVIALIGAGYTNKHLAQELGISENTAKHHVTNIFDKLGVSNRLELVLFAVEHQLIRAE